jgi:hypothetical protein
MDMQIAGLAIRLPLSLIKLQYYYSCGPETCFFLVLILVVWRMVRKPLAIRLETVGALVKAVILDVVAPSIAPGSVTFKLGRPVFAFTKYHIMFIFMKVLHSSIRFDTVPIVG